MPDDDARVHDLLRSPKALVFLAQAICPEHAMWTGRVPEKFGPADNCLQEFAHNELGLAQLVHDSVHDWQWAGGLQEAGAMLLDNRASELEAAARLLVTLPSAQWWWQPLRRDQQTWIGWPNESEPAPSFAFDPSPSSLDEGLPKEMWWTSSPVGVLPAAWLFFAWEGIVRLPLSVWSLRVDPAARVFEIITPADWVALCERYRSDTTSDFSQTWQYNWDFPAGKVTTPDWAAVARDWDGVHLTMAGLLTASSMPLSVLDGHTMLEGWHTERTIWFRWAFEGEPATGLAGGAAVRIVAEPGERRRGRALAPRLAAERLPTQLLPGLSAYLLGDIARWARMRCTAEPLTAEPRGGIRRRPPLTYHTAGERGLRGLPRARRGNPAVGRLIGLPDPLAAEPHPR